MIIWLNKLLRPEYTYRLKRKRNLFYRVERRVFFFWWIGAKTPCYDGHALEPYECEIPLPTVYLANTHSHHFFLLPFSEMYNGHHITERYIFPQHEDMQGKETLYGVMMEGNFLWSETLAGLKVVLDRDFPTT